ncbi:MAG: glycosyltransferase, partial [Flavobacteriales bacterium]
MSDTEGKLPQNRQRKRVLVVSYYWPPSGGGGVQRWLKFAKLLPEFGWDPVVVTPSNPDVPVTDPSLLNEVHDGVEVWSFPVWEPTRALSALGLQGNTSRLGADQSSSPSLASKVVKWVRGNVFVPDARVGWVKPTTRKVLARLRLEPVDFIVTTGPPHSMHLIGLALKRATGLPWVADFRDPWSTMDYLDDFGLRPRPRRLIANMERVVVTAADRILVTSPGALREIGLDDTSKGAVIPNGWDKDDFSVDPPAPASNA